MSGKRVWNAIYILHLYDIGGNDEGHQEDLQVSAVEEHFEVVWVVGLFSVSFYNLFLNRVCNCVNAMNGCVDVCHHLL